MTSLRLSAGILVVGLLVLSGCQGTRMCQDGMTTTRCGFGSGLFSSRRAMCNPPCQTVSYPVAPIMANYSPTIEPPMIGFESGYPAFAMPASAGMSWGTPFGAGAMPYTGEGPMLPDVSEGAFSYGEAMHGIQASPWNNATMPGSVMPSVPFAAGPSNNGAGNFGPILPAPGNGAPPLTQGTFPGGIPGMPPANFPNMPNMPNMVSPPPMTTLPPPTNVPGQARPSPAAPSLMRGPR